MLMLVVDVMEVLSVTIVPLLTICRISKKEKLPQILNCGRDMDCGCMECRKNYPPHPKIDSQEQQRGLSLLGSSEDNSIRYYGCKKQAFPFMVHFPNNSKSDK